MGIQVGAVLKGSSASSASQATTGVTTNSNGAILIGVTWSNSATFTSIVDSRANTWTQIGTETTYATARTRWYLAQNIAGGTSHTVTVTISGAAAIVVLGIEVRGGRAAILDQAGARNDAASPFTLAAGLTTTYPTELLASVMFANSSSNPATNAESGLGGSTIQVEETNGTNIWAGAIATALKTAVGTFNPSWTQVTGGTDSTVALVTFFEAHNNWRSFSSQANPGKGPGPRKFQPLSRAFSAGAAPSNNLDVSIDAGAVTVAGQSFTASINVPVTNGAVTLAGQSFTSSINVPIAAGAVTLAGQSFTTAIGVPIAAGAVTLTGQTFTTSINVPISNGTVTLAGQDFSSAITGTDLAVTIDAGSIVVSGQLFDSTIFLPPTTGVGSTGGGGGIDYQRVKRDHRRPHKELKTLLDEALPEVYAELHQGPKHVVARANAIVAPFKSEQTIDWARLEKSAAAVGRLLALVSQQRSMARKAAERDALHRSDENWFLMS